MQILYTAREKFDSSLKPEETGCGENGNCCYRGGNPWEGYKSWSGLYHLKELITLDSMLNKRLPELCDWHTEEYWRFSVEENMVDPGFFTSLDYVLRMKKRKKNLISWRRYR